MKLLKSIHFYIDVICIIGLVTVLGVFDITVSQNPVGLCGITLIALAIGLNGYASGMKDGIKIMKDLY